MKNKCFLGFTITELIIAMGIIGVISALTVPVLIAHYQTQSLQLILKKTYGELRQNLDMFQTESYKKKLYASSLSTLDGSKTVTETAGRFLTNYFRVAKDCETTAQPCFADSYRTIDSATGTNFSCNSGYNVLLASGAAICLIPPATDTPAKVYIDVNGQDKPNIGGRDMFTVYIYDDFSIDEKDITPDVIKSGDAKDDRETLFNNSCKTSYVGEGCFGKMLNDNWKVSY